MNESEGNENSGAAIGILNGASEGDEPVANIPTVQDQAVVNNLSSEHSDGHSVEAFAAQRSKS